MRLRFGTLGVLGLAIWGCGPPEIIPMTPPGISPMRMLTSEQDQAEALGEQNSKGVVQTPEAQNANRPVAAPGPGTPPPVAPKPD